MSYSPLFKRTKAYEINNFVRTDDIRNSYYKWLHPGPNPSFFFRIFGVTYIGSQMALGVEYRDSLYNSSRIMDENYVGEMATSMRNSAAPGLITALLDIAANTSDPILANLQQAFRQANNVSVVPYRIYSLVASTRGFMSGDGATTMLIIPGVNDWDNLPPNGHWILPDHRYTYPN